jgi:hypothetical protein
MTETPKPTPSADATHIALEALRGSEKWLRECSDWLLANDLDMTCPMQIDPLDLADQSSAAITAIEAATQPSEGEVERVARAICHGIGDTFGDFPNTHNAAQWDKYSTLARAAIAAMKGEG